MSHRFWPQQNSLTYIPVDSLLTRPVASWLPVTAQWPSEELCFRVLSAETTGDRTDPTWLMESQNRFHPWNILKHSMKLAYIYIYLHSPQVNHPCLHDYSISWTVFAEWTHTMQGSSKDRNPGLPSPAGLLILRDPVVPNPDPSRGWWLHHHWIWSKSMDSPLSFFWKLKNKSHCL